MNKRATRKPEDGLGARVSKLEAAVGELDAHVHQVKLELSGIMVSQAETRLVVVDVREMLQVRLVKLEQEARRANEKANAIEETVRVLESGHSSISQKLVDLDSHLVTMETEKLDRILALLEASA